LMVLSIQYWKQEYYQLLIMQ